NHYGYQHISFINRAEIRQLVGSDNYQCGSLDSFSCHLHPLNYALGLARAATEAGVEIFENSRVTNYSKGQSSLVTTANGTVAAKFVILACNGYLEKLEPQMASKIMPINNFMLATEPLNEALCRELIRDDSAIADALFVVDYWRISGDNRLLFGGGENYTRRFPSDIKSFVRKYMLRVYPQLQDTHIDYAWGGTLAITLNRMPHFGRLRDNIFFAQGYSGHGVAMATMAGKLMAEAVAGTAERFDVMANYPTHSFPGGTLLRWPGLVAGMLFYSLRDKL
ncbi:MAG: FAD-binding oxidoreductase, partial [Porticoccaceae bacterium]|nr:FAD-binding oxidoreductase [Porticoccaceae bacterium]